MWSTLSVLSISVISYAQYGGGLGSDTQPYQIKTLGHWQALMNTPSDWDKNFVLTANLDFQGLQITPIGNSTTPFTGVFDGQRYEIHNAVINLPNENYVGLFGAVGQSDIDSGHILNLGVEDILVIGNTWVGGLVGCVHYGGTIEACYVTGEISGKGATGGLCGESFGLISACYASANVNGSGASVGGLVGQASYIYNCYSTGNVTQVGDYGYAGGLAGSCENVSNSFSTGRVISEAAFWVGGLSGSGYSPNIESSFWDVETSLMRKSSGGIGVETSVMQNPETYLNVYWDFVGEIKNGTKDIWYMPPEGGYPLLAWQVADLFFLPNDEMAGAIPIVADSSISGSTVGATGLDITRNGYNDCLDVWYAFDCVQAGQYTITLKGDFDTTLAVFDGKQREIVFNDEFFGGKSQVILNAVADRRYYIRVAGNDAQTGTFDLSVTRGTVQAIQGDLNYDGKVNLVDLAIMAQNWLLGTEN